MNTYIVKFRVKGKQSWRIRAEDKAEAEDLAYDEYRDHAWIENLELDDCKAIKIEHVSDSADEERLNDGLKTFIVTQEVSGVQSWRIPAEDEDDAYDQAYDEFCDHKWIENLELDDIDDSRTEIDQVA